MSFTSVAVVLPGKLALRLMRSRLRRDLTAALKARDEIAVAALRSAIAAIDKVNLLIDEQQPGRPARQQ